MSRANAPRTATLSAMLALALLVGVVLERIGVPLAMLSGLLLAFFLTVMLIAAFSGGTMQPAVYFAGGRVIKPSTSAAAFAAAWMSGGVLLAIPIAFVASPTGALAFLGGSVVGVLLLMSVVAPGFRRSGAYSLADFIAWRTHSPIAGALAGLVIIILLLGTLCLQISIGQRTLGQTVAIQPLYATLLFAGVAVLSVWPGGIFSCIRGQAFALAALAIGILAPLGILVNRVGFASVFDKVMAAPVQTVGASPAGDALPLDILLIGQHGTFTTVTLALTAALAVAVMPSLLGFFAAVRSQDAIRRTGLWAVLLMLLPIFAVIVLIANGVSAPSGATNIKALTDQMLAALGQSMPTVISIAFSIAVLAAALSTATAVLHAISSTIAHDLYRPLVGGYMTIGYRLIVARIATLATAVAASYAAMLPELAWIPIVIPLLSLSAGVLFPVTILALWWSRLSAGGVVGGLLAGTVMTLYVIAGQQIGKGAFPAEFEEILMAAQSVFNANRSGYPVTVVLPVTLVVAVALSLMSRRPVENAKDQVTLLHDGGREPLINRADFVGIYPIQKRAR